MAKRLTRQARQTVRPAPPPWTAGAAGRHAALLIAAALVVLNLVVYADVGGFAFTNWDDPEYITANPRVTGGLTWPNARWAIAAASSPYWHPLTWLSHLADVSFFGLDAGAHHLVNLALHAANTLLVFALLRRMTGAVWQSGFVAAMFAAHPLHVESVAWVAERKDVLSTSFLLLTIGAYVAYVRRPHRGRYALVCTLFALALAAKPMVVTLPVVLLLLDFWPLGRGPTTQAAAPAWLTLALEKLPLAALAAATGIATLVIQHRVGAMAGLEALPWTTRLTNAAVSYVAYIRTTIWPSGLAAFYPLVGWHPLAVAAAVLLLAAVTAAAWAMRRRHSWLIVGWLWFVVTLAPVAGLLQAGEQARADRFMYVPIVGLLIVAAWGVAALKARVGLRAGTIAFAAAATIVASAAAARAQAAHWRDSVALWRHAVRVTDGNYRAYEKLGEALRDAGALDEALASYRTALSFVPAEWSTLRGALHNGAGIVMTRQGRLVEAATEFANAARLSPDLADAHTNLGNALASQGQLRDAAGAYGTAIRLDPAVAEPHVGLGNVRLAEGRGADAIPHFTEALRLEPGLAEAHNGLGAALAMTSRPDEALIEYDTALRLKPDLASAHYNAAVLLVRQGRIADARSRLERALASDPAYSPARQLLDRLTGM